VHLIPNFTECSLCYQKLCLGFLIRSLNAACNVDRIPDGSDSLLQATSHSANDRLAKVDANPNSKSAFEQSLDIGLYILFHALQHIKTSENGLETRTFRRVNAKKRE
jgi:hypothetical protein